MQKLGIPQQARFNTFVLLLQLSMNPLVHGTFIELMISWNQLWYAFVQSRNSGSSFICLYSGFSQTSLHWITQFAMVVRRSEIPSRSQIFSCLAKGSPSTYFCVMMCTTVNGETRECFRSRTRSPFIQPLSCMEPHTQTRILIQESLRMPYTPTLNYRSSCLQLH